MYIKWIACNVIEQHKKEFSTAQEQWAETQNTIGFMGQAGGWDLNHTNTAYIISIWKNENSLHSFMKNMHDKIVHKNNQSKYYHSITTAHYHSIVHIEGEFSSLTNTIKQSTVLEITDYKIKTAQTEHFESAQKSIWIPALKESKGMLGSKFCKATNNISEYLTLTFWDSLQSLTTYKEQQLPGYKVESTINNDILKIRNRKIMLVNSWKIMKNSQS